MLCISKHKLIMHMCIKLKRDNKILICAKVEDTFWGDFCKKKQFTQRVHNYACMIWKQIQNIMTKKNSYYIITWCIIIYQHLKFFLNIEIFEKPILVIIDNIFHDVWICIYVWKLNQTVFEIDFWAVKFLVFPWRDLNSHHWYTAAPIA